MKNERKYSIFCQVSRILEKQKGQLISILKGQY